MLASLTWLLAGCPPPAAPERELPPPALPDLEVARLSDLLTGAHLEWLVLMRPEELARIEWLKPSLGRVVKDDRLDLLAKATGIQLREVPELALASYRQPDGSDAVAFVLRHRSDPLSLERKFRERLTSGAERSEVGHQLVGMWGYIGRAARGFAAIGPHVVGYQYGGDRRRGPARVALLYGEGKLKVPPALGDPSLGGLATALGAAPVKAFLPGPFEGELARGARGLFAAATAVAAALTPTASQTLALDVLIGGAFPAVEAPRYLEGAWDDLVQSDLGHLLGLGAPKSPAAISVQPESLALHVELDAAALLDGLSAATTDNVADIMK